MSNRHVRDWAGLPDEVLVQIFQRICQQDRLFACARTCSMWRAPARAADTAIIVRNCSGERYAALQDMLLQYGPQLEAVQLQLQVQQLAQPIVIHGASNTQSQCERLPPVPQLPCAKLRELVAANVRLQAPLLPAAAVVTLTKLVLTSSCFVSSTSLDSPLELAGELQQLTSLQHLCLSAPVCPGPAPNTVDVWCWLQHMQQLTHLTLHAPYGGRLAIKPPSDSNTGNNSGDGGDGSDSSSAVTRLPALQSLDLERCDCNVAVLSSSTALQHLSLEASHWDSDRGLYSWLEAQQQLTHLRLANFPQPPDAWYNPVPSYRAFAPSTKLQSLDLYDQLFDSSSAYQRIFVRQLPNLTRLRLPMRRGFSEPSPADVQALANSCPALQDLDGGINLRLEAGIGRLQALTRLDILRGVNAAAAAGLTPLTRLKELTLWLDQNSRRWKKHDFQNLWRLSQLTSLRLRSIGGRRHIDNEKAASLHAMNGLVRLDMQDLVLSELQLKGFTNLQKLTQLVFFKEAGKEDSQLGVLLLDRLELYVGSDKIMQQIITLQSTALPGAPPDVAWKLQQCFTPTSVICSQLQQHSAILAQQLAAACGELAAACAAAPIIQQATVDESFTTALKKEVLELRQQLASCQAENSQLHRQLGQFQQWAQHSAALAGQLCSWSQAAPVPLGVGCGPPPMTAQQAVRTYPPPARRPPMDPTGMAFAQGPDPGAAATGPGAGTLPVRLPVSGAPLQAIHPGAAATGAGAYAGLSAPYQPAPAPAHAHAQLRTSAGPAQAPGAVDPAAPGWAAPEAPHPGALPQGMQPPWASAPMQPIQCCGVASGAQGPLVAGLGPGMLPAAPQGPAGASQYLQPAQSAGSVPGAAAGGAGSSAGGLPACAPWAPAHSQQQLPRMQGAPGSAYGWQAAASAPAPGSLHSGVPSRSAPAPQRRPSVLLQQQQQQQQQQFAAAAAGVPGEAAAELGECEPHPGAMLSPAWSAQRWVGEVSTPAAARADGHAAAAAAAAGHEAEAPHLGALLPPGQPRHQSAAGLTACSRTGLQQPAAAAAPGPGATATKPGAPMRPARPPRQPLSAQSAHEAAAAAVAAGLQAGARELGEQAPHPGALSIPLKVQQLLAAQSAPTAGRAQPAAHDQLGAAAAYSGALPTPAPGQQPLQQGTQQGPPQQTPFGLLPAHAPQQEQQYHPPQVQQQYGQPAPLQQPYWQQLPPQYWPPQQPLLAPIQEAPPAGMSQQPPPYAPTRPTSSSTQRLRQQQQSPGYMPVPLYVSPPSAAAMAGAGAGAAAAAAQAGIGQGQAGDASMYY